MKTGEFTPGHIFNTHNNPGKKSHVRSPIDICHKQMEVNMLHMDMYGLFSTTMYNPLTYHALSSRAHPQHHTFKSYTGDMEGQTVRE